MNTYPGIRFVGSAENTPNTFDLKRNVTMKLLQFLVLW